MPHSALDDQRWVTKRNFKLSNSQFLRLSSLEELSVRALLKSFYDMEVSTYPLRDIFIARSDERARLDVPITTEFAQFNCTTKQSTTCSS